jgi:hypothetical protein
MIFLTVNKYLECIDDLRHGLTEGKNKALRMCEELEHRMTEVSDEDRNHYY